MNKRIIALAVAAVASSAAFAADDGVTLYGKMNVGLFSDWQMNTLINGGPAVNSIRVDNLSTNSRIGFKGQEDLGGGLKSYFKLETGVAPDNSANSKPFGSREAWVGLITSAGTVSLGRGKHPFQLATEDFDLFDGYDGATLDLTTLGLGSSFDVAGAPSNRQNNAIKFDSANWGGFSFSGLWGTQENKTAGTAKVEGKDATNLISLSAKFETGDLWIDAAYDQTRNTGDAQNKKDQGFLVGAGYTLGNLSFAGAFQAEKDDRAGTDAKRNKFLVNAAYAIDKLTLKGGVIYNGKVRTNVGDVRDSQANQYVFGVNYALSKRTALIAEYTQVSFKNKEYAAEYEGVANVGSVRKDPSALVLGLMHNF